MTIVARLLRTASTFHADAGIFDGCPLGLSSKVPKRLSPNCHCSDLNDLIKRCAKEKRKKKNKEKESLIHLVSSLINFKFSKKQSRLLIRK
jgi:hypothetical protein